MTVIVWDGKTLAADKMACYNDMQFTVDKLHVRWKQGEEIALAVSGTLNEGMAMIAWFLRDGSVDEFPKVKEENFTRLIVAQKSKSLLIFENHGEPIIYKDKYCAFGSGSELAMGALDAMDFLGITPDAIKVVEIVSGRSTTCGFGYDFHTFE